MEAGVPDPLPFIIVVGQEAPWWDRAILDGAVVVPSHRVRRLRPAEGFEGSPSEPASSCTGVAQAVVAVNKVGRFCRQGVVDDVERARYEMP